MGSKSMGEQMSPRALYPFTFAPSHSQYLSLDVSIYVSMCVELEFFWLMMCTQAASPATFQGNYPPTLLIMLTLAFTIKMYILHLWAAKYIKVS